MPSRTSPQRAPSPEPEHFVQFYEDDDALGAEVAEFLRRGLDANEPVVLIAEPRRREQLERAGLDFQAAVDSGLLLSLDAQDALEKLLVSGKPDARRFKRHIADPIARHAGKHARVWAFGEMVNLLWASGNAAAALQLEELWNGVRLPMVLMCAYHKGNFIRETATGDGMVQVCRLHHRVEAAVRTRRKK